jgi:predicted transcriptional regulator
MTRDVVTVRMAADKRAQLDALARAVDRDRSWLINEAVDAYLAVHRWQIAHIEAGLRDAEAGDFASDEDVEAAYRRWR